MYFKVKKLVVIYDVGMLTVSSEVVGFEVVRSRSSELQRGSYKDVNEITSLTRPKIHPHIK